MFRVCQLGANLGYVNDFGRLLRVCHLFSLERGVKFRACQLFSLKKWFKIRIGGQLVITISTWFWYHSISLVEVDPMDLLPVYFRSIFFIFSCFEWGVVFSHQFFFSPIFFLSNFFSPLFFSPIFFLTKFSPTFFSNFRNFGEKKNWREKKFKNWREKKLVWKNVENLGLSPNLDLRWWDCHLTPTPGGEIVT